MDDFYDGEIDPEMATAMGFSAFGGQKKRKYRPEADAFIDDPRSSSGANNTDLGIRKKRSEDSTIPDKNLNTIGQLAVASGHPEGASAGLSQFIAQAQSLPPKPPPTMGDSSSGPPSAAPRSFPTGVPKRFFDQLGWKELEAYRKGVKDENGDIAYFLPSFVEDPWAKLEQLQKV